MPVHSTDPRFCCPGCRVVFDLLGADDLGRYYDLGGGRGQPVGRPPQPAQHGWLPELLAAGIESPRVARVVLDVQGLHCTACVWLLTELWNRRAGAQLIQINSSIGRVEFVFDPVELDLADYLREIERLGYRFSPAAKSERKTERALVVRLGICVALALNAMMFAFSEYCGMTEADGAVHLLFRRLSFGFATLSVLCGGPVFFRAALVGVRQRVWHLDQPISLGILLAYAGSVLTFFEGGSGYFDTVTVFVALMLAGRLMQRRALARNRDYLLANTGAEFLVVQQVRENDVVPGPLVDVASGDVLLLAAGDLVPTRSRLLGTSAEFSLDWINGESRPRRMAAGDEVPAGAFLRSTRAVRIEALESYVESGLPEMLAAPRQDADGDRLGAARSWLGINQIYVVAVLVLAVLAGGLWWVLDPAMVLPVVVSVLVVTCPCALGLATPLALDLVLARLRRRGIYVRAASVFDRLRRVRKVVFDKTGTLTWGDLEASVVREPDPKFHDLILTMATASGHPVSRGVAAAMRARGARVHAHWAVVEEVGAGLRAEWNGQECRLGSEAFVLGDRGTGREDLCLFSCGGHVEACFAIAEDVRPGFRTEVQGLQDAGLQVYVLSGDRDRRVSRVAAELGVPPAHVQGELSPEDKAERIRRLDERDTLMIGDGLNDAPAFAEAWVSGAATLDRPAMPSKADFFFLGDGGGAVREVLAHSGLVHRVVRTNLILAALYNVLAVALCFAGQMTPLLCAVLMPLSSLLLLAHTSLRLRR